MIPRVAVRLRLSRGRTFLATRASDSGEQSVRLARLGLSVFGVFGAIAATLAVATIWLLLTDPVTVADAVQRRDVSPIVRALAGAIYDAMKGLFKYI
jgi:hypothetical protein